MSLSSILQSIQRKGKLDVRNNRNSEYPGNGDLKRISVKPPNKNEYSGSSSAKAGQKEIDPTVARLKAARKAEIQKKKEALELKSLKPNKKEAKLTERKKEPSKLTQAKKMELSRGIKGPSTPLSTLNRDPNKPTKKKNFNELMKQANQIDNSKLSISIKSKSKSPDNQKKDSKNQNKANVQKNHFQKSNKSRSQEVPHSRNLSLDDKGRSVSKSADIHKIPIPTRKPSSLLQERLSAKKKKPGNGSRRNKYSDDGDDDDEALDDFVVDDEYHDERSQKEDIGYNRDEIWMLFNRGRKRSYYDRYDDLDSADDMEATGNEIFEEENKSRIKAVLEDQRELAEEQRLAILKKERLKKIRSPH